MAAASRLAGVSRQTGSLWVARAREFGLLGMGELSRRPRRQPTSSPPEVEAELLRLAGEYPHWGPRKLLALAYPDRPPVCERTAARILSRAGRRVLGVPRHVASTRFERAGANELWQVDFKLVGPRKRRVDTLSVLDDATRFLVALRPCPNQTWETVRTALWEAFGEHGLPEAVLSDNGPAFRNNATWRWGSMDLWLMLLGIRSLHGSPYHPQTQGKVERMHGTMEREKVLPEGLAAFRDRYNWVRPHEALDMKAPGTVYTPSARKRPDELPAPWFTDAAHLRKTDGLGKFTFKGKRYRAGIAFRHGVVGVSEDSRGHYLEWAGQKLCPLEDLALDTVKDVMS